MLVTLIQSPQFQAFLISLLFAYAGYRIPLTVGPVSISILLLELAAIPIVSQLRPKRLGTRVVPLFVASLGLAYAAGGPIFLLITLMAVAIVYLYTAQISSELYRTTGLRTIAEHWRLVTGLTSAYQIVDDGKIILPSDGTARMGPCLTIISPGHAILFQSGSRETRLTGPSMVRTERFEAVKRVYDLRPRHQILEYNEVRTAESLELSLRVEVNYSLEISQKSLSGRTKFTDDEALLIARFDEHRINWITATEAAIEKELRQTVSSQPLLDLTQNRNTDSIETLLVRNLTLALSEWGIRIDMLHIVDMQPSPAMGAVLHESFATQIEETARTQAWYTALRVLADGYTNARARGMNLDDMRTEVLRRMLDLMSEQKIAQEMAPPDTIRTLQLLRRALGL